MKSPNSVKDCPCGSGNTYSDCCALYHQGGLPSSAEVLMRSRYTAYVLRLEAYLLKTWHPDTRPATLNLVDDANIKWLGLQVLGAETTNQAATVEFVARYKDGGNRAERIHEISQFVFVDTWYYVTGKVDYPSHQP